MVYDMHLVCIRCVVVILHAVCGVMRCVGDMMCVLCMACAMYHMMHALYMLSYESCVLCCV